MARPTERIRSRTARESPAPLQLPNIASSSSHLRRGRGSGNGASGKPLGERASIICLSQQSLLGMCERGRAAVIRLAAIAWTGEFGDGSPSPSFLTGMALHGELD